MALTHVCIWKDHKWTRITVAEAKALHPGGTVSAYSGLFMCELCNQFVIFTDGEIRDRYFRHTSDEASKDCPEHSNALSSPVTFNANVKHLPIRLKVTSQGSFELMLGLFCLPVCNPANLLGFVISITAGNNKSWNYLSERLSPEGITYLSIGSIPYEKYTLKITPDIPSIRQYWPGMIDGIPENGAIFDGITGKKLPSDSDVQVNQDYFLLTQRSYFHKLDNVTITKKCHHNGWFVYVITATAYEEDAAKFFIGYHCRLTKNAVSIIPLWPTYIKTPYLIHHIGENMMLFLRGDATPKIFPPGKISANTCDNGQLLIINCNDRQQLLSAGRTKILKYTYLWQDELVTESTVPDVTIKDISDNIITYRDSAHLPKKNTVVVSSQFDGYIEIIFKSAVINKLPLSASVNTIVENLEYGQEIRIFQGLDCIRQLRFSRNAVNATDVDDYLFLKLASFTGQEISISHRIGALAAKMDSYPKTKEWLCKQIRKGSMPIKAYKLLSSHFFC